MEKEIDFKEYLIFKRIDADKFKLQDVEKFSALESIFMTMHPDSFTAQKLFLINPLRRKYLLKLENQVKPLAVKTKIKPAFKPKLKK